jgi:hypothetical protein
MLNNKPGISGWLKVMQQHWKIPTLSRGATDFISLTFNGNHLYKNIVCTLEQRRNRVCAICFRYGIKAIVGGFLKVESTNQFWILYSENETKRKELGKERLNVLSDYVENYDNLADAKFDEVVASMISLRKSNHKLIDSYYKK